MRMPILAAAALSLATLACHSSQPSQPVEVRVTDPAQRDALFATVLSLEGQWQGDSGPGRAAASTFRVTSHGSVVRETMLPGTPNEMTNMYTLDGNALVMTHYCASGNQPTMQAVEFADGKLDFEFQTVRDLKGADEAYMGEMTLVLVDENHIEQHWRALKGGQLDHEMVILLTRVE